MIKKVVLLVLVVLCLVACVPKEQVLRIVVTPGEDEVATRKGYQPLVDYIEAGVGMPVELITVADYTAAVEALRYGHADMARLGPLAYVQATEEAEIEVLITGIKKRSGQSYYLSYIIARTDLETLEGATFAYVDPGSMSGYGVPSAYIRDNNIELSDIVFAGSHGAVIAAVKNGSVDAGACGDNKWDAALDAGIVNTDTMKVFAVSDPVPGAPWVVQSSLDPELKKDLLLTLLSAPEEVVFALGIGETHFIVANDSDYDIVRKVWEAMD